MQQNNLLCGLVLALGLLAAGCSSGTAVPAPPALAVSVAAPDGAVTADVAAHWQASLTGGTAPYTVTWDFGGGAKDAVAPQTGVSSASTGIDVAFNPGDWTATVSVADAAGQTASASADYRILLPLGPGGIVTTSAFSPAPDTLYAVPLTLNANVGDEVTVEVISGVPASNLMEAGIRLVFDADGAYVPNSFNIGDPGGATYDADGIWQDGPANGDFLPYPDSFIAPTDPGPDGSHHWLDIGILALGPGQSDFPGLVGKHGAVFNLKLKFSTPGTKTLTFEKATGVDRTFYYSGDQSTHYWGDISNDGTGGVPNSIVIH
jgi:hypothetical protein